MFQVKYLKASTETRIEGVVNRFLTGSEEEIKNVIDVKVFHKDNGEARALVLYEQK